MDGPRGAPPRARPRGRRAALALAFAAGVALGALGPAPGARAAGSAGAETPEPVREHRLHVEGMTCALCAKAISRALRALAGVREVAVDRDAELVRVVAAPEVPTEALVAAIERAGPYRATPLGSDAPGSGGSAGGARAGP